MASARTHCPECHLTNAVPLSGLLHSDSAEYFFCDGCHYVWYVPTGKDGPARNVRDVPERANDVLSLQS